MTACPDCSSEAGAPAVDVLAVLDALDTFDVVTRGELRAARSAVADLIAAGRMPDAAIIMDPVAEVPLHVEVPFDVWQQFRAAWQRAGGAA